MFLKRMPEEPWSSGRLRSKMTWVRPQLSPNKHSLGPTLERSSNFYFGCYTLIKLVLACPPTKNAHNIEFISVLNESPSKFDGRLSWKKSRQGTWFEPTTRLYLGHELSFRRWAFNSILTISGTLRVCVYCYKYFSQQHQTAEGDGSPRPGNDSLVQPSARTAADSSVGNGGLSSSPSSSFLDRKLPHRLSSLMGS